MLTYLILNSTVCIISRTIIPTDVQGVTDFITVAIDTGAGGEDDYAHDRFATLRTVANGFAVLIYSLPKSAGFHSLFQNCKALWEAVNSNSELLSKLVRSMILVTQIQQHVSS